MTTTPANRLAGDPEITTELVREHGLRPDEYKRILKILGRVPSYTELGVFSALWSEHCAYKHSKPILGKFPTKGPQVVQGPGENAGVLRVGDGWAVAFKMESHNHPTAVEPYEGAATGVGGILRDVFTMGARPVALLNSLRFGPLTEPRNRYLLSGAVRGIGDYGNCMGIPTTGGEVQFSPSYSGNPLVNAMCIGVLREEDLIRAIASGVGNELIAVGARTGRDGIHGASFASEELTAESEARRPQVQVGDPFTEKLLMEMSLELIASGHIVGIQDMGAAGLTSSSAEMAARGGVGVEIDTALCPVREADMTPYEILLSESQERMLVVGRKGHLDPIREIAEKWELEAALIGSVTDDGMFRVKHHGTTVVEIPGTDLVDQAPVYHPEGIESESAKTRRASTPDEQDWGVLDALYALLDTPTLGSKRWVFEQYDSTVRASTVRGPGGDAGMTVIPGTSIGIASSADCNSRYVALDPYEGGKATVAEAARNVATSGARPLGITNCLNFGSPEKPEVFFQFREACRGITDACLALDTPVTGGNVSFYNESPLGAIDPTPIIGMIGVTPDVNRTPRQYFTEPGHEIILLGSTTGHLGGSAYWVYVLNSMVGAPPPVDLDAERNLIEALLAIVESEDSLMVSDLSDGGIGFAVAEACIGGPYADKTLGANIELRDVQGQKSDVEVMFGEDHGRAIVAIDPTRSAAVIELAKKHNVEATVIGTVGEPDGIVTFQLAERTAETMAVEMRSRYMDALPRRMRAPVTAGETT